MRDFSHPIRYAPDMIRPLLVPFLVLLAGCPADDDSRCGGPSDETDAGIDAGPRDESDASNGPGPGPGADSEARCRLSPSGTLTELARASVEVTMLDPECPHGAIDYRYTSDGVEVLHVQLVAERADNGAGAITVTGCTVETGNGVSAVTSSAACTFTGTVDAVYTSSATIDGTIEVEGSCPIDASVDATTNLWTVCL